MVLAYLNHHIHYPRLLNLLKIKSFGAPASHIRFLDRLGLQVTYSVTDMLGLESLIDQQHPPIVFVQTGELPYWEHATAHALVVVGYDETQMFIHDPYFENAPIAVPRGDFELAWLERDYHYAVIR